MTASLPGTGLSATTTAEPVSPHIEPGTADARTYPDSGECAINEDGSIGAPYAQGKADQDPPCGVSYLRSSGSDGPCPLCATVTWKISWTGTSGEGGGLPDGTFGTTQDVTVQEIQSVNR
ncbi:secreted protein [Streptomyces azureus]|uniref:Secreted protein n=1 Tax=Streptomyces azureus TaxID=146537 RepID=A0A0K8PZC5_STRAJ|nr:secreted protein [Streptomyces azureus]